MGGQGPVRPRGSRGVGRWVVAAVAVLAAAGILWAVVPRAPVATQVATVANEMAHWQGVRVVVTGTLLRFQDPGKPPYGVVQGPTGARIGVRDLAPWAPLVGAKVQATGVVSFDPHFGIYLAHPALKRIAPGT